MGCGWEAARRSMTATKHHPALGAARTATATAMGISCLQLAIELAARRTFPLQTLADALVWFSLSPLAAALVAQTVAHSAWPTILLLPVAAVAQALSLFAGHWVADENARQTLGGTLLGIHVGLFLLAYGAFIASGSLGAVYLVLDHRLKRGLAFGPTDEGPPLGKLDRLIGAVTAAGVVFWALAIALALVLFARRLDTLPVQPLRLIFYDATIIMSFVVWCYFLVFSLFRHKFGWVGRRASLIVCGGMLLLLASYTIGKFNPHGHLHGFSPLSATALEVHR